MPKNVIVVIGVNTAIWLLADQKEKILGTMYFEIFLIIKILIFDFIAVLFYLLYLSSAPNLIVLF